MTTAAQSRSVNCRTGVGPPRSEPGRGRIGLVLGGGGFPGMAFHAGTLLALKVDLGWDPRRADVIVGTSAGSMIGALLRAGLSPDDLVAWATGAEPLPDRKHVRRRIDRVGEVGLRVVGPRLRRSSAQSATDRGRRWRLNAIAALGALDNVRAVREIGSFFDDWPAERLLIPTSRASDGARVVFGRDVIADVPVAISASCAIPAVFRPVDVGDDSYVDGGMHSPTNADLLLNEGVDTAIILSPMTGGAVQRGIARRGAARPVLMSPWRSHARRSLSTEVRALEAAGIATTVFAPDPRTARVAGRNGLSRGRTGLVAQAAFLGALAPRAGADDRARILERLTQA